MPEKETLERAREDAREGKAPTTQAGEFVKEEIDHVREGKHGARSAKQAIAIGLSKARRAGIKLPPPPKGTPSAKKAKTESKASHRKPSRKRSQSRLRALKKESRNAASHQSLSKQSRSAARRRTGRKRAA